jgi:hypothetical protein
MSDCFEFVKMSKYVKNEEEVSPCNACGKISDVYIEMDDGYVDSVLICKDCLKKALEMLG